MKYGFEHFYTQFTRFADLSIANLMQPEIHDDDFSFPQQNAAYLILRGMKTLHLRIQQQNSTALRMAKLLEAHPKV